MIHAVLRSPRKLPARYNRRVHGRTKALVERRYSRHRQYVAQRWTRLARRAQSRAADAWTLFLRYSPWILLAAVVALAAVAVFSPLIEVREIRVVRSDRRVDVERVQRALAPLFGEHLLFLTQKQVLPLLEEPVPDLRRAVIDKQYPSALIVRLELEPIVALLEIVDPSGNVSPAVTGTGADALGDYLTADGTYVVYPPALVQSGTGTAVVRIVDWGVRPEPWKRLLDVRVLERMAQAEQMLRDQFGETIDQRAVYLRSREFHLQTSRHSLWFDLRSPLAQQIDRYRLFLQSVGADAADLYVDLRLQDRIVYR